MATPIRPPDQLRSPVPTPRSRLTSFEHVLLGMIFIQPSTGYDLKRRFATTPIGVYQPSSGALYPALDRLERGGLLRSEAPPPTEGGRPRRLYHLTEDGRQAHLGWVREPVGPGTVAQDLGLHLLRFVMMGHVLSEEEVVEFLASLRAALAGFVASLEQSATATDAVGSPYVGLAVEHGLAVHRASLAWAEQALAKLTAEAPPG
jgi:PadR family transcriptional regulator, regulatory protein AphA